MCGRSSVEQHTGPSPFFFADSTGVVLFVPPLYNLPRCTTSSISRAAIFQREGYRDQTLGSIACVAVVYVLLRVFRVAENK